MSVHETAQTISAYLDDEVGPEERARIDEHLKTCERCSSIRAGLRSAIVATASLPDVAPTPDEQRQIRVRVIEDRKRRPVGLRWGLRWGPRIWALAGGMALLGAGVVGFALVRSQTASNGSATSGVGGPEAASADHAPLVLASDVEVRGAVDALGEVRDYRSGATGYRVADVGSKQERALESFRLQDNQAGAEAEYGAQTTSAAPAAAARAIAPEVPVSDCLRRVLRSQPYPMMPVAARAAVFEGRDAWLLVYAWTSSTESNAPLDRLQVWIVERAVCSPDQPLLLQTSFKN